MLGTVARGWGSISVDTDFDVLDNFGNVLNLVQHHLATLKLIQKPVWVPQRKVAI